ncbi:hypothetical protein D3C76_1124670 [compost metagenome]
MGDEAHVGFVDAHAEGDGGDHDQAFLVEEAPLVGRPGLGRQAGMVRQGREALLAEVGRYVVDLLARQAVDDTGVAAPLAEERQQLLARLLLGHDAVEDVRPVEARQETLGILQVQARDDFFAGTHVRGGGQGNTWHLREQLGQLSQLQVLGTEVVTPLRYTVGFVDREQGDVQGTQEIQHARLHQTFRCQVEHLHFATANAPGKLTLLLSAQGRVQRGGGHTQFIEGCYLVFHQRDQR